MRQLSYLVVSDPLRPHGLHQTPPSMGFSRQEYWSGLPFPFAGNLPDSGIKPTSWALIDALRLSHHGSLNNAKINPIMNVHTGWGGEEGATGHGFANPT